MQGDLPPQRAASLLYLRCSCGEGREAGQAQQEAAVKGGVGEGLRALRPDHVPLGVELQDGAGPPAPGLQVDSEVVIDLNRGLEAPVLEEKACGRRREEAGMGEGKPMTGRGSLCL